MFTKEFVRIRLWSLERAAGAAWLAVLANPWCPVASERLESLGARYDQYLDVWETL